MDEEIRSGGGIASRAEQIAQNWSTPESKAEQVVKVPGWRWLPTMVNAWGKSARCAFSFDNKGARWLSFIRPDGGIWVDPDTEGCPDITDPATGIQMARLAGMVDHVAKSERTGKWYISHGILSVYHFGSIGEAVAFAVLVRGWWTRDAK